MQFLYLRYNSDKILYCFKSLLAFSQPVNHALPAHIAITERRDNHRQYHKRRYAQKDRRYYKMIGEEPHLRRDSHHHTIGDKASCCKSDEHCNDRVPQALADKHFPKLLTRHTDRLQYRQLLPSCLHRGYNGIYKIQYTDERKNKAQQPSDCQIHILHTFKFCRK